MLEIRQLSASTARRNRASTGSAAVGPATPTSLAAAELQPPAPAGVATPASSRAPALWDEVTLRCLTRLVTAVHALAALHAVLRVQTTLCVRLEVAGRPQQPSRVAAPPRRQGGDRPSPADAYAESTPLHGRAALSLADGRAESTEGGEPSDAAGGVCAAAAPPERPYVDVLAEHDAAARAAHRASIRVLCGVLLGTGLDALAASARTAVSAALLQPGRAAAWSVQQQQQQQQQQPASPSLPPLVSLADVEALLRDAAGMLDCAPTPAATAGGPSDGGLLELVTGWLGSALESGVAAAAAGLRDLLPPADGRDAGGAASAHPDAAAAAAVAAREHERLFGQSRLVDLVLPRNEALAASLLPAATAAAASLPQGSSSDSPASPAPAAAASASASAIAWGPHLLTCLTLDVAASPAFAEALRAGVSAALSLSVASAAAAFAGPAAAAQGGRLAPPHAAQGLRSVTDALLQAQGARSSSGEEGRPAVLGELAEVASLCALCDALMWRARL